MINYILQGVMIFKWYSSNDNYFEKCAIYDNSQDEYQVSDDLKNEIDELVGLK